MTEDNFDANQEACNSDVETGVAIGSLVELDSGLTVSNHNLVRVGSLK